MEVSARTHKFVHITLMVLTVGQLTVLLVFVVHWSYQRNLQVAPKQREICFAKESLALADQSESLKGLTAKIDEEKNATEYCGFTSEILSRVVNKTVTERYNSAGNPELHFLDFASLQRNCKTYNAGKDVAHLNEIASYAAPVQGKPTMLYWKHMDHKTSNLEHLKQEGTMLVKRTGLYFVSSQITLWVENYTDDNIGDEDMRHFVQIISGDVEKILLENALSHCDIIGEESQKTSKLEAVFRLRENDRIFVSSSHPHKLVCAHLKNHFIVYKL